nr:unnamed protein product [Callosobruchus analis]
MSKQSKNEDRAGIHVAGRMYPSVLLPIAAPPRT